MGQGQLSQLIFTIEDGETVSNAQDVRSVEVVAFVTGDSWSGDFTFEGRMAPRSGEDRLASAADFLEVIDSDGTALTVAGAADSYIVPTPALLCGLYGLSEVQLVAASAVSGDQEIVAIVKPR
jgi:hypothetical protein